MASAGMATTLETTASTAASPPPEFTSAWSAVRRASLGQLQPGRDLRDVVWQRVTAAAPLGRGQITNRCDSVDLETEARW
jgi:hypothetical protein